MKSSISEKCVSNTEKPINNCQFSKSMDCICELENLTINNSDIRDNESENSNSPRSNSPNSSKNQESSIIYKEITRADIEKIIGMKPVDLTKYKKAFVHKSVVKNAKESNTLPKYMQESYERYEFLGDSVLGFVIAKYSYERFEDQNEGFLTRIKTKLVNGEALSYFSKELGFGEYILMSRFVEDKCKGRKFVKILEDVFESFIGALYLDFNEKELPDYDFYSGIGFHICEKFLINLIEEKVDFADLIKNDYNYKDQLLRYYQQTYHKPPKYELVSSEQLENEKSFIINVLDEKGEILCTGSGKSKKKAEQNGSKNALIKLNIITDE